MKQLNSSSEIVRNSLKRRLKRKILMLKRMMKTPKISLRTFWRISIMHVLIQQMKTTNRYNLLCDNPGRTSGVCLILWIRSTCCLLTIFSMSFVMSHIESFASSLITFFRECVRMLIIFRIFSWKTKFNVKHPRPTYFVSVNDRVVKTETKNYNDIEKSCQKTAVNVILKIGQVPEVLPRFVS